jgi:hypothetical protein
VRLVVAFHTTVPALAVTVMGCPTVVAAGLGDKMGAVGVGVTVRVAVVEKVGASAPLCTTALK